MINIKEWQRPFIILVKSYFRTKNICITLTTGLLLSLSHSLFLKQTPLQSTPPILSLSLTLTNTTSHSLPFPLYLSLSDTLSLLFNSITLLKASVTSSVTRKKSPNFYKSCLKMISLEKLKILTPLQKLPKNVGDLGQWIVAKGFKKVAQSPINRQIWSHWLPDIEIFGHFGKIVKVFGKLIFWVSI